VLGLGRSGVALVSFLLDQGAQPVIFDEKPMVALAETLAATPPGTVEAHAGSSDWGDFAGCRYVLVSPGVAWGHPAIERARKAGAWVSSEIALFLALCPAPVIGITGTNGKTTTAALTAALLEAGALPGRVWLGGNIGQTVLDRVQRMRPEDWVVLELSSFQLETLDGQSPRIGVVTNITPDHLDRHGSMRRYTYLKGNILRWQGHEDAAVLNSGQSAAWALRSVSGGQVVPFSDGALARGGAYQLEGTLHLEVGGRERALMPRSELPLPGAHNVENALAAAAAAALAGVSDQAIVKGLRGFPGVEHRLEPVRDLAGVSWVNDAKATNSDACRRALLSYDRPIVLLAGGRGKGESFDPLMQLAKERLRALVAFGEDAGKLAGAARRGGVAQVREVRNLEEAVDAASSLAEPGDVALLSPACASFDQFSDFEARGRAFKSLVMAMPVSKARAGSR
jgi:UDP-N-acetylmuramoylalanine--D-glutamate ligase